MVLAMFFCFYLYNVIERIGNRIVSAAITIAIGVTGFYLAKTIVPELHWGMPLSVDVAMVGVLLFFYR